MKDKSEKYRYSTRLNFNNTDTEGAGKMQIKDKAINYGEPRHGRSCANCVYYKLHKALGSMCELHDLRTSPGKCCGTWGGETTTQPVEEKQEELF